MIAGPLAALAPAAALWLTARVERDGAAVVWAAGLALWFAGTGPFLLLALVVAVELAAGAVGWLGCCGRAAARRPDPAAGLVAGLAPAVALSLARPLGSLPLLWDAALVGALAVRAADVSGTLVGRPLGERRLGLPSQRPATPGTPGAASGAGLAAAAVAAALVAAVATGLGLLASGDAALVAGAAVLAKLAGGTLAGRAPGPARDLLAGVVAAALSAGLVVALP